MLALQAGCIAASKAGDEPWHADICHYVNNHTGSCCRLRLLKRNSHGLHQVHKRYLKQRPAVMCPESHMLSCIAHSV